MFHHCTRLRCPISCYRITTQEKKQKSTGRHSSRRAATHTGAEQLGERQFISNKVTVFSTRSDVRVKSEDTRKTTFQSSQRRQYVLCSSQPQQFSASTCWASYTKIKRVGSQLDFRQQSNQSVHQRKQAESKLVYNAFLLHDACQ